MCMKVVGIAEARRRLPQLVRAVADGHGPVYVGRRGRAEVVLTVPSAAPAPPQRRELAGLVAIVSHDALVEGRAEIRAQVADGLARKAEIVAGPPKARSPRRR